MIHPTQTLSHWPIPIIVFALGLGGLFGQPPTSVQAASPTTVSSQDREALENELDSLTTRLEAIKAKLKSLSQSSPTPTTPSSQQTEAKLNEEKIQVLDEINIVSTRIVQAPQGITRSVVSRDHIDNQPAKDFRESLESIPGVVLRQRNGPRDFSISIRGFGAKQAFGVRKIKMFEDGFSLTQSDGLSRLDLQDPWFMESITVENGPSSALNGNFALGGTVDFRTRRGRDIDGVETFVVAGSYGYQKYATAIGKEYKHMDAAVFVSHERGDGFRDHSEFDTTTVNANFRFKIDDDQTVTVKASNNDLDVNTPQRLTLQQFQDQPKQAGNGAKANDRSRRDHRTIIGLRYTNRINPNTEISLQGEYDNKDINQKFGIILDQEQPNWKTRADVHHDNRFLGQPLRSHVGIFFDYMESESTNFRNLRDFNAGRENAINNSRGSIRNIGFRIREEWDFHSQWTFAAGLGYEYSQISIDQVNFGFMTGTVDTRASANRTYHNVAPDVSLTFHPTENTQYWGRVSSGYGTPSLGNLTTNSQGLPGANNDLDDERNINIELGSKVQLNQQLAFSLVGFWTFFKDELISQSVFGGTGNFTGNADSSEYRGLEVGVEWIPIDGLTLSGAYTLVDAKFINFTDTFVANGVEVNANRDGSTVPAVEPNVLNLRTAYDHSSGLGGWVEVSWLDDYFVNNANTLKAQSATVVNINAHYAKDVKWGWVRFIKTFVQVDNLFDQTYMGSGAIVADSTADASKQAFLLAPPLSVFGGITIGLF